MAQMEFRDVSYSKDEKNILKGISAEFEKGDFITVVGPSGSGKSTLLKLCCHLISPTEGSILYEGVDLQELNPVEFRKQVSCCFQNPVLFGKTVEENLMFPYIIRKKAAERKRIDELLMRFSIDPGMLKEGIHNLSGGEKQRIALARTLLFKPEMLLLDEITSSLDAENVRLVEDAVRECNRDGVTVLWVTHDPEQSRRIACRQLEIENGTIKSWEVLQ